MAEVTSIAVTLQGMESGPALACRSCRATKLDLVVDLGTQPLANSYIPLAAVMGMEPHYPLVVFRCPRCSLVQVPEFASAAEIFSDYRYLSSYSSSWLDHARRFVDLMGERFALSSESRVVEIASNDGYLLQYAVAKGYSVLGVEPAANVARVAKEKGIPTEIAFFGVQTAKCLLQAARHADLMVANNVLAHVPDVNDFVAGFAILLEKEGVATFEFPHLLNLVEETQFDTIYHEHFSYLSLHAACALFERHALRIFDVEKLPTHGGSLRLYVAHASSKHGSRPSVRKLIREEEQAGLLAPECYERFATRCRGVKNDLLSFLLDCAAKKKSVMAYGAAAKGNTLLNFCGVKSDLIPLVADRSPYKQGCLLPGTRIPVGSPEQLVAAKPDYVLILPWNLKHEISESLKDLWDSGCRFVTAIPELRIF